jgi:hypothetical protein
MAFMNKYQTGTGAARTQTSDEMPTKTSVVSSAEGPSIQEDTENLAAEELANPGSITTRNPSPAETREMATEYIKESEDKKISGGGVRAMRRHGGTAVMAYGFKRRDFKKMRVLLAAAGIFVPDMTHLKRCGFFWGVMSKRERLRRARKKIFRISDRRRRKEKKKSQELRQKRGPRWDSNPRGYEQKIGPAQQRTGKHEPSSYAHDRGHKSYKHQDIGIMQGGETRRSERETALTKARLQQRERKAESKGGGHKQRAEQRTSKPKPKERTRGREARGKGN